MKKISFIAFLLVAILLLACCSKTEDPFDYSYPTRTSAFYGNINQNCFWFESTFNSNGSTYSFTQATNGANVTTIVDYSDNTPDTYQIYDGTFLHKLDLSDKSYDTVINSQYGQQFLFTDSPTAFYYPSLAGEVQRDGKTYYCESFDTGTNTGYKYYFEDYTLKFIEISENNRVSTLITLNNYANQIPDTVYVSLPTDFRPDQLEQETVINGDKFNSRPDRD